MGIGRVRANVHCSGRSTPHPAVLLLGEALTGIGGLGCYRVGSTSTFIFLPSWASNPSSIRSLRPMLLTQPEVAVVACCAIWLMTAS